MSERALPWHEHLRPLVAVQDLINLAYEGFVPVEQARVHFKYKDGTRPLIGPEMWNSRLMAVHKGVQKPKSMTEFPMFSDEVRSGRPTGAWRTCAANRANEPS